MKNHSAKNLLRDINVNALLDDSSLRTWSRCQGRTSYRQNIYEMILFTCAIVLQIILVSTIDEHSFEEFNGHADTVAVRLRRSDYSIANEIAAKHGYVNQGQIGDLENHFLYKRQSGRISKRHALETLGSDPDVDWHEIQLPKKRVKRDFLADSDDSNSRSKRASLGDQLPVSWSDPLWQQQWFLRHGAVGGYDMSVEGAWKLGYSGKGVVISILDDGIEPTHPDLAQNYDPRASKDINDGDDDPTPRDNGDNKHGTRCAGEVSAVAGNDVCGVGVAYNSSIGGVRMLDGPVSDSVEAASLSLNQDHIDIYSASWGPEDDGRTFDGPGPLAKEAFFRGVTKGRGGKGNIFIWASGNGGSHLDSCSCDGYTTSIYTLSVSSATFNNQKPWYLEECPSTLTTTYSSAGLGQPAIVTVDMPHSCTDQHTGTSASAPLAAGIVALALEANPSLTWRDMQHLVMRTSDPTPLLNNPGWIVNGVGRKVSNRFGYGLMHAENLVKLAKTWTTVPEQHVCSYQYHMTDPNPRPLSGRFVLNFSLPVAGCSGEEAVNYLEQAHVLVTAQMSVRGDFQISLISPQGTRSLLLPARPQDQTRQALIKWPFLSVQQWGEDPRGTWTLTVENVGSDTNTGSISDWTLILYGTDRPAQPNDPEIPFANTGSQNVQESADMSSSSQDHGLSQNKLLTAGCHEECDKGCYTQNSDTACEGCKHYSLHKRNRGGVRCVSKCSVIEGYWADEKDKRCKQCMSECKTCSSGDQCDSCRAPQLLVLSNDTAHVHHGRCHKDCPEGFEEVKGNFTCLPIKGLPVLAATACENGHYLSLDSHCVKHCPDGQYATQDFKCLKCPEACRTCIGSSADDCIDCADGFQRDSNTCKPITFMVVSKPKSCHEEGGFMDMVFTECKPCHTSCDGCTGPSAAHCLRCNSDFKNYSGLCISQKSKPSSHKSAHGLNFTQLALMACGGATVLFLLVFFILMCKDRNYERHAKLYSYSALPVKYALDTKEVIITPGSSPEKFNGKLNGRTFEENSCFALSDDDEDEEDTLFAHDQLSGGNQRKR